MKANAKNRMYKNPVLEILSMSGPVMMCIYHVLVISLTFSYGYILNHESQSISLILVAFLAGIISWSLGEYILHRYLFHFKSKNRFLQSFHYAMHGYHHKNPNDIKRLFMPPVPASIFLLVFFGFFYLLMGSYAWYFLPGFELGYLIYSLIHYAIHRNGTTGYFKNISHHHILHHYKYPDKAYGISTKVWDRVFRTMP